MCAIERWVDVDLQAYRSNASAQPRLHCSREPRDRLDQTIRYDHNPQR